LPLKTFRLGTAQPRGIKRREIKKAMSAFIVDRHHIVYLVKAACSRQIAPYGITWSHDGKRYELKHHTHDREAMARIANRLWRENVKSVSTRYPDLTEGELPGPIGETYLIRVDDLMRMVWNRFDPTQVIKSCHCYVYQSCEHDGGETSEAYAFIKSLESSCMHSLPGYDSAEWGAPASQLGTAPVQTRKVVIGGTGFHGSFVEEIEVDESRIWDRARINATYEDPLWFPDMMVEVDERTIKRLDKNACGMNDCCCGSGVRILDMVGDMYLIRCEE